jgi:hypothetical protein
MMMRMKKTVKVILIQIGLSADLGFPRTAPLPETLRTGETRIDERGHVPAIHLLRDIL